VRGLQKKKRRSIAHPVHGVNSGLASDPLGTASLQHGSDSPSQDPGCYLRSTLLFALLDRNSSPLSQSPRQISGIYPSLAMFNNEGECGTGAVVPFADRLWVVTYAPHMPKGSSDKLYEITPDLQQIVRPESIGGTPGEPLDP
jgi:hypothetical protein